MDDIIRRMRLLEIDHAPDGWPAVQMRDITALLERLTKLETAEPGVLMDRITELEQQLSRYQGGVEVEGFYSETYENLTGDPCITLFDRLLLNQNQRVRVIVLPEERIVDANKTMEVEWWHFLAEEAKICVSGLTVIGPQLW